jgi:hypothetical protein
MRPTTSAQSLSELDLDVRFELMRQLIRKVPNQTSACAVMQPGYCRDHTVNRGQSMNNGTRKRIQHLLTGMDLRKVDERTVDGRDGQALSHEPAREMTRPVHLHTGRWLHPSAVRNCDHRSIVLRVR